MKSNMFCKRGTNAVPEGHRRARAKLAERHCARAGGNFIFHPLASVSSSASLSASAPMSAPVVL